jgi:hypothetical protein
MVKLLTIAHPVSFYSRTVAPVPIHADVNALLRAFPPEIHIILFKSVILYFAQGPNLFKLVSFENCFYSPFHVDRIRKKTYSVGPPGKMSLKLRPILLLPSHFLLGFKTGCFPKNSECISCFLHLSPVVTSLISFSGAVTCINSKIPRFAISHISCLLKLS